MQQRLTCAAALAVAASVALGAGPSAAQDTGEGGGFFSAKNDGDFMVRLRGIAVVPLEDSSTSVAGGDLDVSNSFVPELDFTYFITDNIALELIAAMAPHEVKGAGALAGIDLGNQLLLPPTLTLQYHFTQFDDRFKPYVGAGLNYTFFFTTDDGDVEDVEIDDGVGYALQAGFDYQLSEGLYLNVDVKQIFLNADVTAFTGAGNVTADLDLNPLIVGAGIGYRF